MVKCYSAILSTNQSKPNRTNAKQKTHHTGFGKAEKNLYIIGYQPVFGTHFKQKVGAFSHSLSLLCQLTRNLSVLPNTFACCFQSRNPPALSSHSTLQVGLLHIFHPRTHAAIINIIRPSIYQLLFCFSRAGY